MKTWAKGQLGFTILETMIVMSVSASMLVTVIFLFGGEQQRVQRSQSLRDIESKLQDVINDTSTGYFPQDNSTTCTARAGDGGGPDVQSGGANEQGTSQECVFLGRAIHLDRDKFVTYPLVGNKQDADTAPANSTFAVARPVIVPFLAENYNYYYGMRLKGIYWDNDPTNRIDSGALLIYASSPNGTGQSVGGGLNPGLQRVSSFTSGDPATASVAAGPNVSSLNAALQNPSLTWPVGGYVVLCFGEADGGNSGGIVLSGGSRTLDSSMQLEGAGYQCL